MSTLKFPPKLAERRAAELLSFLESMEDAKLLKVARIALDIAQDRAEASEANPGVVNQLVTAHTALGLILTRAAGGLSPDGSPC